MNIILEIEKIINNKDYYYIFIKSIMYILNTNFILYDNNLQNEFLFHLKKRIKNDIYDNKHNIYDQTFFIYWQRDKFYRCNERIIVVDKDPNHKNREQIQLVVDEYIVGDIKDESIQKRININESRKICLFTNKDKVNINRNAQTDGKLNIPPSNSKHLSVLRKK